MEYLGHGALRDAVLNMPALAKPLQVRSADVKLTGKAAGVDGIVCSLGGSTLRGGITVRNFSAPAVDFKFDVDRLDVAELQQSITGSSKKGSSAGSNNTLTAKGTLSAGTFTYADVVLKQLRSECSYANGVLKLAPLTAQVFGGTQTGAITVDLRSEPAAVAVDTKLESVDANQLLAATTSLKRALYGLLAASGNASMKLLPGTAGTRSLNGNLGIRLTKGRLGGINLMNELSSLGRFVGMAGSSQPFTDVVSLEGDVQVRDGVASSDNLALQVEGGSVSATGTVNLVDESVNLRLTAVLAREMSEKVGGSRVGGYLTSVLVNNRGELVIPAIVTGTFAKPRFAPDAARVAEMKLKNVLPSTGKAGTIASGVVGLLSGEKRADQQGAAPSATTPAAAEPKRKGVLGVLERLQKSTQQPPPAQPATPR